MDAKPTTTDAEIFTYWGVLNADQPIHIERFPCGHYVCPNDQANPGAAPKITAGDTSESQRTA